MKKILVLVTAIVLAAGAVFAMGPMGKGGGCCQMGMMDGPNAAVHKKFMADSLNLRQEMSNKHFELQREYLKEKPDQAVLTTLRGEITALQTKIKEVAVKSGMPANYPGYMGGKSAKGMRGGMMGCGMATVPANCPMMNAPASPAEPAK